MDFDQGELDFSGNRDESGYKKWQEELDQRKRAFEQRHGVIIGRRVKVQLRGEQDPLEGVILIAHQKIPQATARLKLSMGKRNFTAADLESIVRLEEPEQT